MNLVEFRKYLERTKVVRQSELYRQADLEINGDKGLLEKLGEEIEKHPIGGHRKIRQGCFVFD